MFANTRVRLAAMLMLLGGASSVSASPITITPVAGLTFTLENLGLSATQFTTDGGAPDTYDVKVTLALNGTFFPSPATPRFLRAFSIDAGTGIDFVGLTTPAPTAP